MPSLQKTLMVCWTTFSTRKSPESPPVTCCRGAFRLIGGSMIVLGLDPSLTSFGWALHDTEAKKSKRLVDKGLFKTTPKQVFVDRYIYMRQSLIDLIDQRSPDRVGIEYPVFNDLWSEGMYGLFLYCSEALRLSKIDTVLFSPMQLKAHARISLGRPMKPRKWVMQKGDMVEAAKKDTGGKGRWNHNEADAYWAAYSAGRFWNLHDGVLEEGDLTEPEASQFLKIHTFLRGKKAGQTVQSGILHREDDRYFLWSEAE